MSITNGYCTEAEAIAALFQGTTPTANELAAIDLAVEAASRQIDQYCNRYFYLDGSTSARVFTPDSTYYCKIDDVGDTTGMQVAVDVTGFGTYTLVFAANDYQLEPQNSLTQGRPYSAIRARRTHYFPVLGGGPFIASGQNTVYFPDFFIGDLNWGIGIQTVQVTALWGWPSVPAPVKQATIIQASMLFKAPSAPFGVAGSVDVGQLRITQQLHPTAKALVEPYRREASGVFV